MSDLEYLTGICQSILIPLCFREPITEEEKRDYFDYEREMHQMMEDEEREFPSYEFDRYIEKLNNSL